MVAMVLLTYKIYFIFSKKGCERAIPPTTKVAGLLAYTNEINEHEKKQSFAS